ncbi:glycerate kinase [Parasalinivibrio latis]|uniref:glycerate kinase n=1 Tax=Parasalinivibrio latis TaxID=2952610 RepID=UPI0030E492B8
MTHIVICPDSFKESLSASDAAQAIEAGFRRIIPEAKYTRIPMADGGEGTVQSMVDALGGSVIPVKVTGPLGEQVEAFFGISGDGQTAVIEMAAASGLHLVPIAQRNPLLTSSQGTGELILAALDKGVSHIIIGLGGSATNDGGAGMACALGARLLDGEGNDLNPGGGALGKLDTINLSGLDPRIKKVQIDVACDVDNPLCGPNGASTIFGPQKGATDEMVAILDSNLSHYASVVEKQLNCDIASIPGAGAAGGLGAALAGIFGASLRPGVEIVIETVRLHNYLADADLVITGEGRIDSQTVHGKTPIGVAKAAKLHGLPVIGIAGAVSDDSQIVSEHGIDAIFSITPRVMSLDEALDDGARNLERTAENIARLMKMAVHIG